MTLADLSPRRREVALLVGLNYTRAQIANELGMKVSTVHSTIQQIAARLERDTQVPAMRAVRGWVNSQQRPKAA
jgi:DNA-directed RNA polymerase specialized sigma24 family protein